MNKFLRIRYAKTEVPGTQASVRVFKVGKHQYRIFLHVDKREWEIVELGNGLVVAEGSGDSLHEMKIFAKNHLEMLGVEFSEETRETT